MTNEELNKVIERIDEFEADFCQLEREKWEGYNDWLKWIFILALISCVISSMNLILINQ